MCEKMVSMIDTVDKIEKAKKSHDSVMSLLDVVNKWNSPLKTATISEQDLRVFPIGGWVRLNEGVYIRRKNDLFKNDQGEGMLLFDTIIRNAGELGDHYHEWLVEDCQIITGKIYDKTSNKVYSQGESVVYNSHERHNIIGLPGARLLVTFKRTDQNAFSQ